MSSSEKIAKRTCMKEGCDQPATRAVRWADGRGLVVCCEDHVNHFKRTLSEVVQTQRYDPDAPKGKQLSPLRMTRKGKAELEHRDLRALLERTPRHNKEERERIFRKLQRLSSTIWPTKKTAAKIKQPPGYEAETEKINERKKAPEAQRPHKFQPAKWTHTNGHPRCKLCGDEEPVGGICKSPRFEKTAEEKNLLNLTVEDVINFLEGEKEDA